MKDLNSNSFEFNSNGFELGLGFLGVSKMLRILVELQKMMKEIMGKVWRPRIKITKALG